MEKKKIERKKKREISVEETTAVHLIQVEMRIKKHFELQTHVGSAAVHPTVIVIILITSSPDQSERLHS